MQVELLATTTAKLRCLCKRKEVHSGVKPQRTVGSHLKGHFLFLLKSMIITGIRREGTLFFFFYQIVLLVFGVLRAYPFIFLAFGTFNVGTSPCNILANGGISPVLSDYLLVSESVEREWLQVLLSRSLKMSQPSAHLPTLDMALHIQVRQLRVCGAPVDPSMPMTSVHMAHPLKWPATP